jgi:hypothetical protein
MEREDRHGHVDEVFRERLSELNVTPPAEVWKTVQSALPGRKKVRYLTVFRVAAATLLLFVLTGSLWLIYLNKPSGNDLADRPVSSVNNNERADHPAAVKHAVPAAQQTETVQSRATGGSHGAEGSFAAATAHPAQSPAKNRNGGPRAGFTEPLQQAEMIALLPETEPHTYHLTVTPVAREERISYSAAQLSTLQGQLNLQPIEPVSTAKKEPAYVWGIGGDFGPVFSYRNLPYKTEYTRFLNNQESGTLSYGGSFSVFIKRKKRLSIQSGIGYYRTGQVSKDMVAFRKIKSGNLAILESKGNNYLYNSGGEPGYDHVPLFIANRRDAAGNDQTGYILDYLGSGLYEPVDAELKLDYEFVEVPVLIRYQIIDRAFGVNVTGGMGASLLFNSSASVLTADGENTLLGEIEGLRRTNINSTIGLGVSYRITKDFLFRVEPTFKYYLNPVSRTDGIDSHPFLFGVYSGLSIFF